MKPAAPAGQHSYKPEGDCFMVRCNEPQKREPGETEIITRDILLKGGPEKARVLEDMAGVAGLRDPSALLLRVPAVATWSLWRVVSDSIGKKFRVD